jgi:hypothetical protein
MSDRVNPFDQLSEAQLAQQVSSTKVEKKTINMDVIDRLAEDHGFPSRQPTEKNPHLRRRVRVNATGRNLLISIRLTGAVKERFYKAADERRIALCELLELALDALDQKKV